MDYKNEVEKLKTKGNTFKPKAGSYKLKIMGEPEETQYVDPEDKNNITPQIKLKIKESGAEEEMDWYVGKSTTVKGVYGQLMLLGQQNNSLTGLTITLLVKNDGQKNDYTIVEAVELMKKVEEETVA